MEGEYSGRHLFDRLNLENQNPQTVEIAQRTLSAICHAIGKLNVNDSEELHHRSLYANVRVQQAGLDKRGNMQNASNNISSYAQYTGSQVVAPVAQTNTALAV